MGPGCLPSAQGAVQGEQVAASRSCWKCRIPAPTPELLIQNLDCCKVPRGFVSLLPFEERWCPTACPPHPGDPWAGLYGSKMFRFFQKKKKRRPAGSCPFTPERCFPSSAEALTCYVDVKGRGLVAGSLAGSPGITRATPTPDILPSDSNPIWQHLSLCLTEVLDLFWISDRHKL